MQQSLLDSINPQTLFALQYCALFLESKIKGLVNCYSILFHFQSIVAAVKKACRLNNDWMMLPCTVYLLQCLLAAFLAHSNHLKMLFVLGLTNILMQFFLKKSAWFISECFLTNIVYFFEFNLIEFNLIQMLLLLLTFLTFWEMIAPKPVIPFTASWRTLMKLILVIHV